jgi:hypothetical protein
MTTTNNVPAFVRCTINSDWDASLTRLSTRTAEDVKDLQRAADNSVATGGVFVGTEKTVQGGAYVLGADAELRSQISLGVGSLSTNPALLKESADLIARFQGPANSAPAPAHAAAPPSSSSPSGAGYPTSCGCDDVVATQRACLGDVGKLHEHLAAVRDQYRSWKAANPTAPEPTDGQKCMGEIVDGDMPVHEQCVRLLCIILREHPEILDEVKGSEPGRATIPSNEVPNAEAPAAPAQGGDALSYLAQTFGPLASLLGGFLSSPVAVPLLSAAALLIPLPVGEVVAAAVPFVAPIAGQILQGVGGMAGGAPAAPAGGLDLGALVNGVGGLMNAVGPLMA